jgi:uncharacterized Zn finger protein (UPF0148 family)
MTITATWTGPVSRSTDGTILVPGCEVQVDEAVAKANPHFVIGTADVAAQRVAADQVAQAAAMKAANDAETARIEAERAAQAEADAQAAAAAAAEAQAAANETEAN